MKARLTFLQGSPSVLPYHHQHLIAEVLKQIIAKNEGALRSSLLDLRIKLSEFDLYCFSSLKGSFRADGGGLQFQTDRISLLLSCPVDDYLKSILEGILRLSSLRIGQLELIPNKVEILDKPIFRKEMRYVCLSPFLLGIPGDAGGLTREYINPDLPEFSGYLKAIVCRKIRKMNKDSDLSKDIHFEFVADPSYLERRRESGKKVAHIVDHRGIQIRGYLLPFDLNTLPEIHEFIWDCGIGEWTHEGFGMLDLA